ncbi:hypothetical protein [Macrococcoides caseolyticum]|uniref:hypothetical protein n=1 Tax=Macrococcoides caseolyticum TaxID=69966 RepID=UPI001F1985A5|nr:hypothetical protein [Macrococcus caseolyticus]MCE4957686.1 hypothetical protein [Macrococcus caseolyticus]
MLKEIIRLIKSKKRIQIDSFEWYEELVWKAEIKKIKRDRRYIYADSYFNDDTEKYYIEYYIK